MNISKLEVWLKEMGLKDDGQELDIAYNEHNCSYMDASEYENSVKTRHRNWSRDWVSEAQKQAAMDNNQVWTVHMYSGHNFNKCSVARSHDAHYSLTKVFGEMDTEMIGQLAFIQSLFDKLLVGEHTHASFGFTTGQWFSSQKDKKGPYVIQKATVQEWDKEEQEFGNGNSWLSDESRDQAYKQNFAWFVNWCPHTPIGSYTIHAPTLQELVDMLERQKLEK